MKMHKKLKKVIHPNRYFIWTLVLVVLIGASLIAFINWSVINMENQSFFSDLKTKKVYTSKLGSYSVKYPAGWQIELDQSGNTIFENPSDPAESLTVTTAALSMEGVIRHSIDIKSERNIAKDNMKIAIIKAGSAKDGSDLDVAIIKTATKLYYISGHSARLENFARNFKAQ
jgi:hypothetical protein